MHNYSFGEIVLLQFPYSDNVNVKKRPALVLIDTGDDDIIAARITSQYMNSSFDIEIKEWEKAGLLTVSYVRLHKVAVLEKQLIDKKIGKILNNDLKLVKDVLHNLWNIK